MNAAYPGNGTLAVTRPQLRNGATWIISNVSSPFQSRIVFINVLGVTFKRKKNANCALTNFTWIRRLSCSSPFRGSSRLWQARAPTMPVDPAPTQHDRMRMNIISNAVKGARKIVRCLPLLLAWWKPCPPAHSLASGCTFTWRSLLRCSSTFNCLFLVFEEILFHAVFPS